MKVRKGFISNSSSTSFLCEVCGHHETEHDSVEESEFLTLSCGHVICKEHKLTDIPVKDIIKSVKKTYEKEVIEQLENCENTEEADKIVFEQYYEYPQIFCPICNMKEIPDDYILSYLLKITGKTYDIVISEIKEKFKNFKQLQKFCE